jgi:hypothetical protein
MVVLGGRGRRALKPEPLPESLRERPLAQIFSFLECCFILRLSSMIPKRSRLAFTDCTTSTTLGCSKVGLPMKLMTSESSSKSADFNWSAFAMSSFAGFCSLISVSGSLKLVNSRVARLCISSVDFEMWLESGYRPTWLEK